jgi:signal peptidase II|tara:strand:- start:761 stop:1261 length:501 start_codon:yes stop_codon:yes gene_type:complete
MIDLRKIFSKNNLFITFFILVIFSLDRFTKIKIVNLLLSNNESIYINDYLNLDLVWNTGIGFGLFNLEAGFFYHSISMLIFVVILILIFLIIKSPLVIDKFLYSMILGGALGNFYDRAIYFAVPDFIDIHFNDYHWFTFNFADIFISLGIMMIIFKELFFEKNEKN